MADEQQSSVDDTNISGMSDGLEEFLKTWADDELDPAITAKMLHSPEGAQYKDWLPKELQAAFQTNALNPEFLSMACNRQLGSQQEIEDWLKSVWPLWFDQPFAPQQ
jgi:hypothetical protein